MLVACNNNNTCGCRRNRFSPIIRSFKAFKNTVPSSDRGLTDFNGYHLETDESQIAFLYLLYLYIWIISNHSTKAFASLNCIEDHSLGLAVAVLSALNMKLDLQAAQRKAMLPGKTNETIDWIGEKQRELSGEPGERREARGGLRWRTDIDARFLSATIALSIVSTCFHDSSPDPTFARCR